MRQPAVSHIQERDSPQACNIASLEPLAQCSDTLGGVGAISILVNATERVLVQAAAIGSPDIQSVIRGSIAQLPNLGWERT